MVSELLQMVHGGDHFVPFDYIIYACAFILLAGGFLSAALCAIATFGPSSTKTS